LLVVLHVAGILGRLLSRRCGCGGGIKSSMAASVCVAGAPPHKSPRDARFILHQW
jgi:hypothetical protein